MSAPTPSSESMVAGLTVAAGSASSKEMAEKFAEMLKARLEERKKLCLERWKRYEHEGEGELACYWNGKENEIHCAKADIYEICKEITEGE